MFFDSYIITFLVGFFMGAATVVMVVVIPKHHARREVALDPNNEYTSTYTKQCKHKNNKLIETIDHKNLCYGWHPVERYSYVCLDCGATWERQYNGLKSTVLPRSSKISIYKK